MGEATLWTRTARRIRPPEKLTGLEFGRRHRVYTKEGRSARWRPEDTPWAAEILWALSEECPARRVPCPKGTQLGFTEIGLIWTGEGVLNGKSTLFIEPTEAVAKRVVKTKFRPLLKTTTILAGAFSGRAADTTLHFSSDKVDVIFAGSNSPTTFATITVPRIVFDEVDRAAAELLDEGDPVDLSENRIAEYGFLGKLFIPSSPTVFGVSTVWREWLQSDQRVYECPCPKCGVLQQWLWENMDWEPGKPETAQMRCVACSERSAEAAWKTIWAQGAWRATVANPIRNDTVGFHLSTLYARLGQRSWAQLAQQYIAASESGLSARMQVFENTILGLPWKITEDAVPVEDLKKRLEPDTPRGVVPAGGLALFCGVDYQANRIECHVWAWGRRAERWPVDIVVVSRVNRDGTKRSSADLARELNERAFDYAWPHALGGELRVEQHMHDTGDGPADVFDVLEHFPSTLATGTKGREGWGKAVEFERPRIVDVRRDGKTVAYGRRLMWINTAPAKVAWYDDLRRAPEAEGPSERFVHLPDWLGEEEGLLEQFVSEEIRKSTRGKLKWVKIYDRNEALDCAILAKAAAWQVKAHRWTEAEWERREALVRTEAAPPPEAVPEPRPEQAAKPWINTGGRSWIR